MKKRAIERDVGVLSRARTSTRPVANAPSTSVVVLNALNEWFAMVPMVDLRVAQKCHAVRSQELNSAMESTDGEMLAEVGASVNLSHAGTALWLGSVINR